MNPEKVRCQIIEYTKHEMYLHGADGLTMDDIAKGMKMSKRTLYKQRVGGSNPSTPTTGNQIVTLLAI